MRQDEEFFDALDRYLTLDRLSRQPFPEDAAMANFALSRMHEIDPRDEPSLYFVYLRLLEKHLERARSQLPNRLYRGTKETLEGAKMIWETLDLMDVVKTDLPKRQHEIMDQVDRELESFLDELKGYTEA